MITNTKARLTYQDHLNLPESDDRYELIDGELYMVPAPVPDHQGFLGELHVIADIEARTIEVNVSDCEKFAVIGVYGEGDTFESPLLHGLNIKVGDIFESAKI